MSRLSRSYTHRIAWAIGILVVGAMATCWALSAILVTSRPSLAIRLNPWSSSALAARAIGMLENDAGANSAISAEQKAKESLSLSLVNSDAIRSLAMAKAMNGQTDVTDELMSAAESMSRRDLLVQLWLIEDAVSKGNVQTALQHYDRALTTQTSAPEILFPILAEALSDHELAREISKFIRRDASWTGRFVDYAISESRGITALAGVVLAAGGLPAGPDRDRQEEMILRRLIAEGHFSDALNFAMRMPNANRQALLEPNLTFASVHPRFAPLSWHINDAIAGATAQTSGSNVAVEVTVNPDSSEIALEKIKFLKPTGLNLSTTYTFRSVQSGDFAVWEVACPSKDGTPTVATSFPIRPVFAGRPSTMNYHVSASCNPVLLRLKVSGGSGTESNVLILNSISVGQ